MNTYLAVAVLFLFTGCLLVFPLLPALVELRFKTDAQPLNVIQQHAGEIRHFANGFRTYISGLQPSLQQCISTRTIARGVLPDGCEYLILGKHEGRAALHIREKDGTCELVIVAGTELATPAGITFHHEIYSAEEFIGGEANYYRAIFGEKEVHLGPGSSLMRWAHAGERFITGPDCKLYGRVSSDGVIRLARNNQFLRLNAPRIEFGDSGDDRSWPQPDVYGKEHSRIVGRLLRDGDYEVAGGEVVAGSVVARGRLLLRSGARVCGSVKAREMVLEPGVMVEGSVISSRTMRIGAGCAVHGPIIAEREMIIAAGTCCGTFSQPTTISSLRIRIEEGVVVFGTVWARESGQLVAPS